MTDIIEDAEHFLQRAIDLLDIFLNRLVERLNANVHRPLTRRTLLRWIAAFFPAPVNPRIRLEKDLGSQSHMLSRWASCGSLPSSDSMLNLNGLVEENLGDNVVRYRMAGNTDYLSGDDDDAHPFPASMDWNPLTSTPNIHNASSCSSLASSSRDPETDYKISEMEEELASLRKQIALLVMTQENTTISQTITESTSKESDVSQVAAMPLPVSPSPSPESRIDIDQRSNETPGPNIPPPPPPPPPPAPPLPPILSLKRSSESDVPQSIKKTVGFSNTSESDSDSNSCDVPRMTDILKDLGSVKLKTIERSPGGTPFRPKPRQDPTDPASIIALALKKKFAHHRGFFSPESEKENDSPFASPDPHPSVCSKSTKRRLSLLTPGDGLCSDGWSPVAPPLQTLNA